MVCKLSADAMLLTETGECQDMLADGYRDGVSFPPWLDARTAALMRDIVVTLASHYPDLMAIVLFGSVARPEERSLSDPQPSDVDLLAIFDGDEDPVYLPRGLAITHAIGLARNRHLNAPRDVQVMFASRTMREWDTTFVANVARDGLLVWARGPLPEPLRSVERGSSYKGQQGLARVSARLCPIPEKLSYASSIDSPHFFAL